MTSAASRSATRTAPMAIQRGRYRLRARAGRASLDCCTVALSPGWARRAPRGSFWAAGTVPSITGGARPRFEPRQETRDQPVARVGPQAHACEGPEKQEDRPRADRPVDPIAHQDTDDDRDGEHEPDLGKEGEIRSRPPDLVGRVAPVQGRREYSSAPPYGAACTRLAPTMPRQERSTTRTPRRSSCPPHRWRRA